MTYSEKLEGYKRNKKFECYFSSKTKQIRYFCKINKQINHGTLLTPSIAILHIIRT